MALSQDHQRRLNELVAAAAASRSALTSHGANLHAAFDFGAKFENAIRSNPTVWLSVAAVAGWVLSRLPARRKKIFVTMPDDSKSTAKATGKTTSKADKAATKGLILAGLGLAFQMLKPAIQKLVTEQVTDWTHELRSQKKR